MQNKNVYRHDSKILSKEEEEELFKEIQNGDEYARESIILYNLGMAISVAYRYKSLGIPLEDLQQESIVCLIETIDIHRPIKGRLASHFYTNVAFHMQKFITKQKSLISFPNYVIRHIGKMKSIEKELEQQLGRDIRKEDILNSTLFKEFKKTVSLTDDHLIKLWQAVSSITSLNQMIGDTDCSYMDMLQSESRDIEKIEAEDELDYLWKRLNEEERAVLRLRLIRKKTLREVADELGMSFSTVRNRVRSIQKKANKWLLEE